MATSDRCTPVASAAHVADSGAFPSLSSGNFGRRDGRQRAAHETTLLDALETPVDRPAEWVLAMATAAGEAVPDSCGARVRIDGGPFATTERTRGSITSSSLSLRVVAESGATVSINIFVNPTGAHGTQDRKRLTLLNVALENRLHALSGAARMTIEPGASAMWTALTRGELTLLREGGQLVLLSSPVASRVRRQLSALETEVLVALAGGAQNKRIAANLQCSPGTISRVVSHAAAKLGVTRLDALRVYSILTDRPPVPETRARLLTATERDVLVLVCQGLSNDAIARARQRSPRTVANQIASVLRKTRMPSRRALAAARWDA